MSKASAKRRMIVVSSAALVQTPDGYYAYGPYVREMRTWARHCGDVGFVCPVTRKEGGLLEKLDFPVHKVFAVRSFDLKSFRGLIALLSAPATLITLFRAMQWGTHIHLRCPGNISLLGCLVQMLFPGKTKTAKYAGNWDPSAKQPLSYIIQKWILNNTFFTKKITVLVYGRWPGASHNIKPFFTATYSGSDTADVPPRDLSGPIRMIFAGTLSANKRPLYAIALVNELRQRGHDIRLDLFGDGAQSNEIRTFIAGQDLSNCVTLHGNRPEPELRIALKQAHFAILPSQSEGWPKAIAEGMFWGCVPLATAVSCVPFMLDFGRRGVLLSMNLQTDADAVESILSDQLAYNAMATDSTRWSRQFTVDLFESEIKELCTS